MLPPLETRWLATRWGGGHLNLSPLLGSIDSRSQSAIGYGYTVVDPIENDHPELLRASAPPGYNHAPRLSSLSSNIAHARPTMYLHRTLFPLIKANLAKMWTCSKEAVILIMAELNRPGSNDSDESLRKLWDDENRRNSIQVQNLALQRFRKVAKDEYTEQCNVIEDEEMAEKLVSEAYRALVIGESIATGGQKTLEAIAFNRTKQSGSECTTWVKEYGPPNISKPWRNDPIGSNT
ncbi:hypothetical protein BDR03DRAFT_958162 [Suillus americanus]|nr:hypothetical protein BDR03DRAFT_958162 [Suillus americanus]